MRPTLPRSDTSRTVALAVVSTAGFSGFLAQAALGGSLEIALGSPTASIPAVVVATSLGAAAGALVAEKRASRERIHLLSGCALVVFAAIELLLPYVWRRLLPWPLAARALLGGALLTLPSLGTGLLLPLVATSARRDANGSRRIGSLLSAGLAGGAVGSLVQACVFEPRTAAAPALSTAAIAAALGGAAYLVAPRPPPATELVPMPRRKRRDDTNALATSSLAIGFASGATLLLLTHAFRLLVRDAADTFAVVLAAVLAGLSAGAVHGRTLSMRARDGAAPRAAAAAGFATAATLGLMGAAAPLLGILGSFLRVPADLAIAHVLVATGALTLATSWLGTAFAQLVPHLGSLATATDARRASLSGAAGMTLGAALAGVAGIPVLGTAGSMAATTVVWLAIAVALGWGGRARRSVLATAFVATATLGLLLRAPWVRFPGAPAGASWTKESVTAGRAAVTSAGMTVNADTTVPSPETLALATLTARYAPRMDKAIAADDVATAAALLRLPWKEVVVPRIPTAWHARLPEATAAAFAGPNAVPTMNAGIDALYSVAASEALVSTIRPVCGPGCIHARLSASTRVLLPDGVAFFVLRGAEPVSTKALLRAAQATFAHAGLAAIGSSVIVAGTAGSFVERRDRTPEGADPPPLLVDDQASSCADGLADGAEAAAFVRAFAERAATERVSAARAPHPSP